MSESGWGVPPQAVVGASRSNKAQPMKELFREPDFTRVAFYQSLLEAQGIPTFIRNQDLSSCSPAGYPIPEFYPALCVMNDDDYVAAVQIIRRHLLADRGAADTEIPCPACGEPNPGNFDLCWSCNAPLQTE
jgi:hypothetical protein